MLIENKYAVLVEAAIMKFDYIIRLRGGSLRRQDMCIISMGSLLVHTSSSRSAVENVLKQLQRL